MRLHPARSSFGRLLLAVVVIQGGLTVLPTAALAAAPQTTITSGPSGLIKSRSATFGFKSNAGSAAFQCKMDDGGWAGCSPPKRYSSLGQGAHTFRVRAKKDGATDPTPATRSFTVDTVKPQTTLEEEFPATRYIHRVPEFVFSSNEAGSFQCRIDSAAFAPCTSPHIPELLTDRAYTFQVRARDAAGNVDASPAASQFSKIPQLSHSEETGDALGEHLMPDQLTLDVPASCGGNPEIDCPNGTPEPPEDQLSIASTRSVAKVIGVARYDATVTMDVDTIEAFKFKHQGAECNVQVDSGPGASPTWTLTFQIDIKDTTDMPFDVEQYVQMGNFTVSGVQSEDYQVSGTNLLCSFGATYLPASVLADTFENIFEQRMPPTCMAAGPPLFETCPWLPV